MRSQERMRTVISKIFVNECNTLGVITLLVMACTVLPLPMAAQRQGPLPPPPPGTAALSSAPAESAKKNASGQETPSHVTSEPPGVPVQQIIQKFTEHEDEFRKERDNFTYTQIFIFQELDEDNRPDGEYRLTSDILFTPAGKRYEKVIEAPSPSLKRISMSQQEFDDIEKVWPLVLTPPDLPKTDVKYVGREHGDEVGTYVFDIASLRLQICQL